MIGIASNKNALSMWLVAGPEVSRLMDEFQFSINACKKFESLYKHEDSLTVRKTFYDKKCFCETHLTVEIHFWGIVNT